MSGLRSTPRKAPPTAASGPWAALFAFAPRVTIAAVRQGAWTGWAALASVALLHLGLLLFFIDPGLWFSGQPLPNVDFHTHANQAWRVVEGLEGWGRSWVYDVQLLAGHPTGVIFDADNKAWELWTYLLARLGVARASAFNSFVLLVHLGLVPTVYAAARLFGLGRRRATLAAGLAVLLWWFDPWLHWCWWIGMVAYAAAAYFALLPLALFFRFTEDRRPWQALACGLALGLAHLIHPYSFFILAPPMLALWLRARGRLGARGHLAVVGIAGLTIAVNAPWLAVAGQFWHYILDSALYGQSTLAVLGADLVEWLIDPEVSGQIGARTTTRWLVLAAALLGLREWGRGERRTLPFALAFGVLATLTYLGAYSRITAQIQPYRHIAPLALLATIPAADRLAALVAGRPWRSWPRSARLALALLMIPTAQHLFAEVTYYAQGILPRPHPPHSRGHWVIGASGHGSTPDYRLRHVDRDADAVAAWVRAHDDGQRRFLVELGHLGEALGWATRAQIVGGFTHRNLAHSMANLFRRVPSGALSEGDLRSYLDTYAIGWIIVSPDIPWLAGYRDLVEVKARIGPHVIYAVRSPAPLIAAGGGTVEASTNRIEVRGSDPGADLLLRFHWMETLACEPGCELRRVKIDAFDPVGFIKVPAPHPADLEIVNTYEVRP